MVECRFIGKLILISCCYFECCYSQNAQFQFANAFHLYELQFHRQSQSPTRDLHSSFFIYHWNRQYFRIQFPKIIFFWEIRSHHHHQSDNNLKLKHYETHKLPLPPFDHLKSIDFAVFFLRRIHTTYSHCHVVYCMAYILCRLYVGDENAYTSHWHLSTSPLSFRFYVRNAHGRSPFDN